MFYSQVNCFNHLILTTFLDLSRNNITSLVDYNFRGQDGLHELDLSFNKITVINSWVFQHLKVRNAKDLMSYVINECGSGE